MSSEGGMSRNERLLSEIKALGERRGIRDVDEPLVKIVVFFLSHELFAFSSENVREILPKEEVCPVPGVPDCILGLVSVRGDMESVLDVRGILGLPPVAGGDGFILIVSSGALRSGVLMDEMKDVVDVPRSSILPPPDHLDAGIRDFVAGRLEYHGKNVILLDPEKIFAKVEALQPL